MSPEEIKNIAIYVRVATTGIHDFSLDFQLEKLRAYCQVRNWKISGEYVDAGKSGTTTKRPEYQRMMGDIKNWDGILVFKIDRIHRNIHNLVSMISHLKKFDKQFISIDENIDTSTALGRVFSGIWSLLDRPEIDQSISEKNCRSCRFSLYHKYMSDAVCVRNVKADGSVFIKDIPKECVCPLWEGD